MSDDPTFFARYWKELSIFMGGLTTLGGFGAATIKQGVKVRQNCKALAGTQKDLKSVAEAIPGLLPRGEYTADTIRQEGLFSKALDRMEERIGHRMDEADRLREATTKELSRVSQALAVLANEVKTLGERREKPRRA